MPAIHKLLIIIIILLSAIYVKYYIKTVDKTEIIQLSLNKINYKILNERNPIYMEEKIIDINQVINTNFKHLYSFKFENDDFNKNIKMNLAKYCIFHNNSEIDKYIHIFNPNESKNVSFKNNKGTKSNIKYLTSNNTVDDVEKIENVKIILKPYNALCIPYKWLFICEKEIKNMYLFDITNIFISKFNGFIK
jgi:hypothetical protein